MDNEQIAQAMMVEEPNQQDGETTLDELAQSLNEPPAQGGEEQPAGEAGSPQGEQGGTPPEKTAEQARMEAMTAGLTALREEGVTADELLAFSEDAQARRDVQGGKDVIRAFMAYSRRHASAVKEQESRPQSVPTLTKPGTSEAAQRPSIMDMSKKEFAELSRRAEQALLEGKRVTFR